MPVVDVRVVGMSMRELGVAMPVHVRFFSVPFRPMLVAMVLIVDMAMLMLHRLVHMYVLVPLADMQPYAADHKRGGRPE
jgi:hypothetical protein